MAASRRHYCWHLGGDPGNRGLSSRGGGSASAGSRTSGSAPTVGQRCILSLQHTTARRTFTPPQRPATHGPLQAASSLTTLRHTKLGALQHGIFIVFLACARVDGRTDRGGGGDDHERVVHGTGGTRGDGGTAGTAMGACGFACMERRISLLVAPADLPKHI